MGRRSGIELRQKRATSWMARAEGDLDTQFIFLWIAFNALYGQAHYRNPSRWSETGDIMRFLAIVGRFDRRIVETMREKELKDPISRLLADKYLHDCCWKAWDANKVRDRSSRERTFPDCNEKHDNEITQIFNRLYVLRKQLFHGCSTDGSPKNRPSLRAAVPVLRRFVQVLLTALRENAGRNEVIALLGVPSYPPTEDTPWNTPRVKRSP